MSRTAAAHPAQLTTPRPDDLGLRRIRNPSGLVFSLLPNGGLFALEHVHGDGRIMINRALGSPIAGGMERLWLRVGGTEPMIVAIAGGLARGRIGAADLCFVWRGESGGLRHEVRLQLREEGLVEYRRGRGVSVTGIGPQRSAVVAKARELVAVARRYGYRPEELTAIIEQVSVELP